MSEVTSGRGRRRASDGHVFAGREPSHESVDPGAHQPRECRFLTLVELATQAIPEASAGQKEVQALKRMSLCGQHEVCEPIEPGINVQRLVRRFKLRVVVL